MGRVGCERGGVGGMGGLGGELGGERIAWGVSGVESGEVRR